MWKAKAKKNFSTVFNEEKSKEKKNKIPQVKLDALIREVT